MLCLAKPGLKSLSKSVSTCCPTPTPCVPSSRRPPRVGTEGSEHTASPLSD